MYRNWTSPELVWRGPTFVNKGATQQQNDLAAEQSKFYSTLIGQQTQEFQYNQGILGALNKEWQPILQAGIGQKGFTAPEEAAIRTSSSDNNAEQFKNAQQALNESLASRGGGDTYLPSGAEAQLHQQFLTSGAQQEANTQNQITQANYAQGRQNFLSASGALSGAAQLSNPTGYASTADSAGNSAFGSASAIQQANAQSGFLGTLGGLLGGGISALTGGIGGGLGKAIGGSIGNPSVSPSPSIPYGL